MSKPIEVFCNDCRFRGDLFYNLSPGGWQWCEHDEMSTSGRDKFTGAKVREFVMPMRKIERNDTGDCPLFEPRWSKKWKYRK